MAQAVIQELDIEPSRVKVGEPQLLFSNRVGIDTDATDDFYQLKYDASILDDRGNVIKTMCRENVRSGGKVETGLVHDPTKRAPLRCDPDGIQPDETSPFEYLITQKDLGGTIPTELPFGFKVWLAENSEPSYPIPGQNAGGENVQTWVKETQYGGGGVGDPTSEVLGIALSAASGIVGYVLSNDE
jgi:hypothetical protein